MGKAVKKPSAETETGEQLEIVELPAEVAEKVSFEIALVVEKENVTEKAIADLKENLLPMQINGQEDKEGYLALRSARISVKNLRVAAKKAFAKGREEARLVVERWIGKEKEVVVALKEIEDTLEGREDAYEQERDRLVAERLQKIEQQGVERISHMLGFGAKMVGGNWMLGDIVYEVQLVKESDPEIYQTIFDEFKAEDDKNKAEQRAEDLRKENERKELTRQQDELKQQQADMDRQKKEMRDGLLLHRKNQLIGLGMTSDRSGSTYSAYGRAVSLHTIEFYLDKPQSEWEAHLESTATAIAEAKVEADKVKVEEEAKAETKRLEGLENARKEAIGSTRRKQLTSVNGYYSGNDVALGDMSEDDWTDVYEAAKKAFDGIAAAEEQKRKDEEEAAKSDKQKWADFIKLLKDHPVPAMRSGQYGGRAKIAREKINQILSL